jgi:tyrosyl-tRNA synthetase
MMRGANTMIATTSIPRQPLPQLLQRPQPPLSADPLIQARWLTRNAVEVLPDDLGERIRQSQANKQPLRIKFGIDPTAADLHLGHVVVLDKLREFQALGHQVILIIGDMTARVGDPSGRSKTRPLLDQATIDQAGATYRDQAFRVLDPDQTTVHYNSEWLDMPTEQMFGLLRSTTVAQLLARDDFARRFAGNEPISLLELMYPIIQAYDSVAISADLELGGTDQKFNLLLGRELQQAHQQPPQTVMTMPILVGIDGVQKMSKSLDNAIGIGEPANEIFGRTMAIPDSVLDEWLACTFDANLAGDPLARKRLLARSLAERFAGDSAGNQAEAAFDALHRRHEIPSELDQYVLSTDEQQHLPAIIAEAFTLSRTEARRRIDSGSVRLTGEKVSAGSYNSHRDHLNGKVLQIGKRQFIRLVDN